jgi:molybdate transport system substrate-binding protein
MNMTTPSYPGILLAALAVALLGLLQGCRDSAAATTAADRTLRIAVASAMRPVMTDLRDAFAAANPDIEIVATVGASGNLYAQISNRAPFDLFLASDLDYPRALAESNLTTGSILHYATGSLVLWLPHDSPLDLAAGTDALRDDRLRRLAIATSRHAPYGRAATQLLEKLNLHTELADRLILGENVEQAAKFAQTGAADAALIPMTLALLPPMQASGRFVAIPHELCPGVQHGAVVLKRARDERLARDFLDFLRTPTAHQIFIAHGLAPKDAAATGGTN